MKTIEEQLWDYIDGNCSAEEQQAMEEKIKTNTAFSSTYHELLEVRHELNQINLDAPSMSFTRNVMEKVAMEIKPVALKTKIDKRITYSIWGFFSIALFGLLGYAFYLAELDFSLPKWKFTFDYSQLFNINSLLIFLTIDVALVLLYLDSYLRKRKFAKGA